MHSLASQESDAASLSNRVHLHRLYSYRVSQVFNDEISFCLCFSYPLSVYSHSIQIRLCISFNPLSTSWRHHKRQRKKKRREKDNKMKLAAALAVVFLFGTAHAIPNSPAPAQELEQQRVRFLVPDNVTVKQGSSKCGDQAQLSC